VKAGSHIVLIAAASAELLSYLSELLKKDFEIVKAENGRTAVLLAQEIIPDIVIAEQTMPEKDGLHCCNDLKFDIRTKHIPFILISKFPVKLEKTTGLEKDPDKIIQVPFDESDILSALNSLVDKTKKLQNKNTEWISSAKKIGIKKIDDEFLQQTQALFQSRLSDPLFSIPEFADAMNMSRMQLHRKTTAIFGLSPGVLIKKRRLIIASELLRTSSSSVSEIAYECGFSQPAYFAKCFKQQYGCSPTEFVKKT